MRGTPYLRLRQLAAHALRRALVGSLGLALFAIVISIWSSFALERTQTNPDPRVSSLQYSDQLSQIANSPSRSENHESTGTYGSHLERSVLRPVLNEPIVFKVSNALSLRERDTRVEVSQRSVTGIPLDLSLDDGKTMFVADTVLDSRRLKANELSFAIASRENLTPTLVAGNHIDVTLSFYYCEQGNAPIGDGGGFCGVMRDGTIVYEGAAACSLTYLGQRFRIVGDPLERIYTCHDTGNAVLGLHRDIFFHNAADGWSWLASVGTRGVLEVVR